MTSIARRPSTGKWIDRWSVSRIGKAQSCQRLIYFDSVMGFRSRFSTSSAIQGTLAHKGVLECYHAEGLRRSFAVRGFIEEATQEIEREQLAPVEEIDKLKGRIYSEGYIEWADRHGGPACDSMTKTILGIEREFDVTIDGERFTGIFDMVLYDKERNVFEIHELKTTSRKEALDLSSSYWRDLTYSTQPVVYAMALSGMISSGTSTLKTYFIHDDLLKRAEVEFVYHIIQTTKSKPGKKKPIRKRKAETEEEFAVREKENQETVDEWFQKTLKLYKEDHGRYLKHSFVLTKAEIDQRWDEILDVVDATNNSRQFPRNPGSCGDWGGCAFRKVCSGDESLETSERLKRKKEEDSECKSIF